MKYLYLCIGIRNTCIYVLHGGFENLIYARIFTCSSKSRVKDAIAKIEGQNRLNSQDAEHQPSTTPSTSSLSLSEAVPKDLK